ncbi:NTP transferase domain-containing protein [Mucilaginibacter mali]|uniref:NTP transferase domain-containing protein n=1 Tax=Mucilaginibacter mali TaxID=2740462 RepID=A0A7D4U9V2_9SPHI|nr:nucleotidyltransferase family protein [Mucilaginibacter mali]QKJ29398.1 NTP transferase domain-containing protein [Mucilaginibacter mali]
MKYDYKKHLILSDSSIKIALATFNELGPDAILFVINRSGQLVGSLTDGDVRRGLLKGLTLENNVDEFVQPNPKYIQRGNYTIQQIIGYRDSGYKILPVIDYNGVVVNIINFRFLRSYLPIDAIIMAGGRGERLRPLTDTEPKPMLKVGDKPIIEHNLDRLADFGIDDFWISVKYLGEKIKDFFKNGEGKGVKINYLEENLPLGTIGCVSTIATFEHDHILVTNSDVLTNLDYEQFFLEFIKSDADFSVATIPYNVNIPYAILETQENLIRSFKEKPTYTYFANAGIYLMKKEMCERIPRETFYNATDLMDDLIKNGFKVTSYPLRGYWLDIGKHDDYIKAQQDIKYIKF